MPVSNFFYRQLSDFTRFASTALRRIAHFVQTWPVLTVSIYLALVTNTAFWRDYFKLEGELTLHVILFAAAIFVFMVCFSNFLILLVRYRLTLKPVLIALLVISSMTSYFMNHYGVLIDAPMIQNVFDTDANEALDLVNWDIVSYVLLLGVLPALVIAFVKISYKPLHKQLLHNSVGVLAMFALLPVNYLAFSADYSSFFRTHHYTRHVINPFNYIASIGKVVANTYFKPDGQIVQIGLDAHQKHAAGNNEKKSVLVLVVGETARATNFSLNGYKKDTNPLLSKEEIINYTNVHSCGTSTNVSVPCMFSSFTHDEYDASEAQRYEKLLDVLKHAGINVLWRDNNTGCKGVCKNVSFEDVSHLHIKPVCNDRECFDEILLENLYQIIESSDSDTVIVLHQKGSHGPAYYLRYPPAFKKFQPTCDTNELGSCSEQAIVNTYDNTIAYTDYFLSRIVSLLKLEQDKYDTAMLYVSDHGESLGESNLYLHGLPYMIAPETQKYVPMITWYSPGFLQDHRLDKSCLKQAANNEYSHDNLFHSVLGLMDVSTTVYNPKLDIYHDCSNLSQYANRSQANL